MITTVRIEDEHEFRSINEVDVEKLGPENIQTLKVGQRVQFPYKHNLLFIDIQKINRTTVVGYEFNKFECMFTVPKANLTSRINFR